MATQFSIPSNINLLAFFDTCRAIIGRSPYGTDNPTTVIFDPDPTADELTKFNAIIEIYSARSNFQVLPQWATWTATEAESFVSSNIFGGLTQAQVDSQIDALPATIAGMKTGLKQAAAAILSIRSILMAMAKAIVYLRNLVVSVRQ